MERTQSGACRSWPKRTSPLGSPCGSLGSTSSTGKTPWEKTAGSWEATVARTSLPQPSFCPEGCERPTRGNEGSILENGSPRDGWEERPITPTLLGYEVMEERAKFTIYKVLVRKNHKDSWVIFRRYTDFSRLNDKLKELFPRFRLALPPKRWFKDNYEMEFLEERQIGLQTFLQNLIAHKDITNSEVVRQFLCLDDPPGPFDSLEESRAFCETLEETNRRLQRELQEKQREINSLQRALAEGPLHIEAPEKRVNDALSPESSGSPCRRSEDEGVESSADADTNADSHRHTDMEGDTETVRRPSTVQADLESRGGTSCDGQHLYRGHGVSWCPAAINGS